MDDPLKLFVIYIGGAHDHSLIELHDMRFVVASTIEETYPELRDSWWGTPMSLHVDAWGVLNHADGYKVSISIHPPKKQDQQLYFVNLGGYDQNQFTELHQNIFIVASDAMEAKQKAVQHISGWESPHRDYLHQVDSLLNLSQQLASRQTYLHLEKETQRKPFEFVCRYTPIGKR